MRYLQHQIEIYWYGSEASRKIDDRAFLKELKRKDK